MLALSASVVMCDQNRRLFNSGGENVWIYGRGKRGFRYANNCALRHQAAGAARLLRKRRVFGELDPYPAMIAHNIVEEMLLHPFYFSRHCRPVWSLRKVTPRDSDSSTNNVGINSHGRKYMAGSITLRCACGSI